MRLVSYGPAGFERAGVLDGDQVVDLNFSNPRLPSRWRQIFARGLMDEVAYTVDEFPTHLVSISRVRLGPPVPDASKIVCLGLAYAGHAEEGGKEPPSAPQLFCKATTTLTGPYDDIVYPRQVEQLDYEVELAVVVGRRTRHAGNEEAAANIAGYMVLNDVSARCAQFGDKQWFRGKSFDTFCPCGPAIVTPDEIGDPDNLPLKTWVNGDLRQNSSTSDLLWKVSHIVSYVSDQMTLLPGDMIATGTPEGVGVFRDPPGLLSVGDLVEMEVEGIGRLKNRVVAEGG